MEENTTRITLKGSAAEADGPGVRIDGSAVTITGGGVYILEGTLREGQILVSPGNAETVRLVLNGAEITGKTNAAIYSPSKASLFITLAEGTENTLRDAREFIYADTEAKEPDAALFSSGNLTINGTGALTVTGNYRNGIGSKDSLLIENGTISVGAKNHGIRGKDSVTVLDGNFTITAGNDGIQTSNDKDPDKGWVSLQGGTYQITSDSDGIQAETALTVSGGNYAITSGGGSTVVPDDSSRKGLKAGTDLTVTGGSFTVNSADDAVHSNGNITIGGGSFRLATGDDAVHADRDIAITGGDITVTASVEGIEGNTVTISGGTINLVSGNDGINITGDHSGQWLSISGGAITVDAEGDGIDINGSGEISGGIIHIHGPVRSMNGALDYDGTLAMTGGTLFAAGTDRMAQSPSQSSKQPSLMIYYTATQPAGTAVAVLDSGGKKLAEFTAKKEFRSIVISIPDFKTGSAYTVRTGSSLSTGTVLTRPVTAVNDKGSDVPAGRRWR
ncbi:carbohydrate-binding domain-containing protein [Breznakiella homolactica]|uniref:Carbohydrate-binding domain-containing protein n=1 Tax=Breznakiella homolactica TaxID=2798577 RepID=A0A7T8BC35_9SPIR|nr:carbohydrate-binding domain-containing protein [Breznakiella homolactica]QQO10730.1 carbohydrate-binding domain-containing protein [Breznakiella homolactica]